MNPADPATALAAHPFCQGLTDAAREQLAPLARFRTYAAGSLLVQESQPADYFLLIQTGHVTIEIHSPKTGATPIQTLGPGDVVGWSWLVPPHQWHFDARALDPVHAIVLDGNRLRTLCQENHEVGRQIYERLLAVLAGRLAATRLQLLGESK